MNKNIFLILVFLVLYFNNFSGNKYWETDKYHCFVKKDTSDYYLFFFIQHKYSIYYDTLVKYNDTLYKGKQFNLSINNNIPIYIISQRGIKKFYLKETNRDYVNQIFDNFDTLRQD